MGTKKKAVKKATAPKKDASKKKTKKSKAKKVVAVSSSELFGISSKLKRGDISKIASITMYDASHVSRVLNGDSKNPSGEIVKAAKQLVSKRK